jgi:hypothetical protein
MANHTNSVEGISPETANEADSTVHSETAITVEEAMDADL